MKRHSAGFFLIALLAFFAASCGWKPEVTAVPVTAPWSAMSLPIKENAVVWKSEPENFRAVHKENKQTIVKKYSDALKAQGFTLANFDTDSAGAYTSEFEKGAEKYSIRVYDFDNTGVVIEKK